MKRLIDYTRFALLTYCLIVMPVACAAPPRTPEQTAQHAATVQALDETQASLVVLAQQLEGMTPGTPEHLAVSQQIVDAAQRGASLEQDLADQDTEAATGWLGGIVDLAGMFIPGTEAFKPAVLSLGLLAFDRPRDQFLKAASKLNPVGSPMAPVEAARHILAGLGLLDSTEAGREARKVETQAEKVAKAEAKVAQAKAKAKVAEAV